MPERETGASQEDGGKEREETLAEKARRLVASPQGRKAIDSSLEHAMKGAAQLKKERRLNPEDMYQPLDRR